MKNIFFKSLLSVAVAHSLSAYADHGELGSFSKQIIEEVYVTGGAEAIRTLPGSAAFLDAEAIKAFDSTDLTDVLGQVPGVYIRFEDGYGLRPNIGIRGATSDRSQKITLMEDGILIAPSPYSAPAAYYIPNVNRMDAVEVFKGPSSIQYGPHTVGGALNLVTRAVPETSSGEIAATLGNDGYQKYRAFYGNTYELDGSRLGFWVDALRFSADGFKELDGQDKDTGFARNDINAKLQWQTTEANRPQSLIVKLGYADEDSNETYLGLTDQDFYENPVRRYSATSEDQFVSEHTQIHAIHSLEWTENFTLTTRAYINRFDRDWQRFDGFFQPPFNADDPTNFPCPVLNSGEVSDCTTPVQDILEAPEIYAYEYAILTGQQDGLREADIINVVSNDRVYGSQGLELSGEQQWVTASAEHTTSLGVRYHEDYVERNHQPLLHRMESGRLVFIGESESPSELNKSEVSALALYANHEVQWDKLKLTAGLRFEDIDGTRTDFLDNGNLTQGKHSIVIPGVGAFYQWTESLGLLAGVNKGFSPSVAGSGADPEESINYEYGFRYEKNQLTTDIIGFYSDYSNLIARCRASESTCTQGEEFNGGAAIISGVEVTSSYAVELPNSWSIPFSLSYTYTDAAFDNTFESRFSQWGNVARGDELPYTPAHQARFATGIEANNWSMTLESKFVSKMREVAEQGSFSNSPFTRSHTLWDAALRYTPSDEWDLLLAFENIFDKQVIVSRRPFGARPNQPRSVKAGVTYAF